MPGKPDNVAIKVHHGLGVMAFLQYPSTFVEHTQTGLLQSMGLSLSSADNRLVTEEMD